MCQSTAVVSCRVIYCIPITAGLLNIINIILVIFHLIDFLGEYLGADVPDILHIGDDQHSAIYNHSEW